MGDSGTNLERIDDSNFPLRHLCLQLQISNANGLIYLSYLMTYEMFIILELETFL